jgi:hypothetical protein
MPKTLIYGDFWHPIDDRSRIISENLPKWVFGNLRDGQDMADTLNHGNS